MQSFLVRTVHKSIPASIENYISILLGETWYAHYFSEQIGPVVTPDAIFSYPYCTQEPSIASLNVRRIFHDNHANNHSLPINRGCSSNRMLVNNTRNLAGWQRIDVEEQNSLFFGK